MIEVKLIWEEKIYRDLTEEEAHDMVRYILNKRTDTNDASDIVIEQEVDGTYSVSNRVVTESYVDGELKWKSR